MIRQQDDTQDRPILDRFIGICMGISLVVGVAGLVIGSRSTVALGGSVQFAIFPAVGVFATACSFAPTSTLTHPKIAASIGTNNPVVARVVCCIAAIIFWVMSISALMSLMGRK
jgi:hypothetical protein